MKFLIDNFLLIAIALVSGGLLVWPLIRRSGGGTALTPLEATQLINHRNAIVVDVRDEKAFALGSLAGARNIPFEKLSERAAELVRFKARPVLLVCESGQQSTRAIETFKAQGFEEGYSLAGGIGAWRQAALPLVHPAPPGRDIARDAPRKNRNEGRSRSNRQARSPSGAPAPAEPVVGTSLAAITPVAADIADTAEPSPSPDPATPARVKELS